MTSESPARPRDPHPPPMSARRRRPGALRVADGMDFCTASCHPKKKVSTPQHSLVAAKAKSETRKTKCQRLSLRRKGQGGAHKASNHRDGTQRERGSACERWQMRGCRGSGGGRVVALTPSKRTIRYVKRYRRTRTASQYLVPGEARRRASIALVGNYSTRSAENRQ
jgi:hypothetical protein